MLNDVAVEYVFTCIYIYIYTLRTINIDLESEKVKSEVLCLKLGKITCGQFKMQRCDPLRWTLDILCPFFPETQKYNKHRP